RGAVWIVTINRENDRLLARLRFAPGAVGKEAVLPKCPQVSIERVNPFLRSALHQGAPAAFHALFQQRRENALKRPVKMIEDHFHGSGGPHAAGDPPPSPPPPFSSS